MMNFERITDINDPRVSCIKDDPVRPHIPLEQRINEAAELLILRAGEEILAATCMQWLSTIPTSEEDLVTMDKDKRVAVFYTIWSYAPGAGAKLIKEAANWILKDYQDVDDIVTLSPPTEMARRFHTKNGATVHQTNSTTVNYQYYRRSKPRE
jgi:hypothetical protein